MVAWGQERAVLKCESFLGATAEFFFINLGLSMGVALSAHKEETISRLRIARLGAFTVVDEDFFFRFFVRAHYGRPFGRPACAGAQSQREDRQRAKLYEPGMSGHGA